MAFDSSTLPHDHRALYLSSTNQPLEVKTFPVPQPTPGSAVVKILAAPIISYMREVYNGTRKYTFPPSFIPGTSAIARVAAVGSDAVALKVGDLVLVDCLIRGRDDPTVAFLSGLYDGFTEGSKKLMSGEWRNSTYAEYAKVPLETCERLSETMLLGSKGEGHFGYTMAELTYIATLLVPFGGLRDVGLQVGETVIIAPATGPFGGAAVHVALAMGARVIAMGRNKDALTTIAKYDNRVATVPISGNVEADTAALLSKAPNGIDVFFDISPPAAADSTHLKSAIMALRHGGRVSLMGGIRGDLAIPHSKVMHWNITLKGKWMYERSDIKALIKMVEAGFLKLGDARGVQVTGTFGLEEWEKAFDVAAGEAGFGKVAVFVP